MLGPKKRQVGGCTGALLRSALQAGRALRNACTEGPTPVDLSVKIKSNIDFWKKRNMAS
jgi:hypothetical protein